MSVALSVKNVSKQYRLGLVGSGTLRDDLMGWWYRMRGLEDPTLKIGEENDRTKTGGSNYVWALQDINFDVQHGEVLGIIGKNGAGKSTLLKLLSRVTAPTTGIIKAKGRIASLLEVGTGFHPELTGRENIFLNGAIMGMNRHEIKRKLDEIVAFAGVERYLDTPVKRYSSGMYVRLAFAVAAHLEPEILIVDEVLAVGDAEFQKKAIGKMKDVSSGDGRTVLFVSHNMKSVKALCNNAVVLEHGKVKAIAPAAEAIETYLSRKGELLTTNNFPDGAGQIAKGVRFTHAAVESEGGLIDTNQDVVLKISFEYDLPESFYVNFILRHMNEEIVTEQPSAIFKPTKQKYGLSLTIPKDYLNPGLYAVQLNIHTESTRLIGFIQSILEFQIREKVFMEGYFGQRGGYIRLPVSFEMQ